MKKLYLASIWAPNAIPPDEWKYRNMKRVMFPAIDVLFFIAGLSAARYGVPAISEFFPDVVVDLFAYVLSVAGIVCLLGVSFPKLWPVEIGGKAVILSLMVGYIVSLFILTSVGEGNRGFVLLIATISICGVLWRVSLLGAEWQVRRLVQEQQRKKLITNSDRGIDG